MATITSIIVILLVAGLIITLIHGGTGKVPLWPAVLLLFVVEFITRFGTH